MWTEILENAKEDLEKYSAHFNDIVCGPKVGTASRFQKQIKWEDAHCYFYEDDELRMAFMYKYDAEINRMVTKNYYIKFLKVPTNPDKLYEVLAENCIVVLERFNKIIRVIKYKEYFIDRDIGKSEQEDTNKQIEIYKKIGVKVTDYPKYREYEWM